MVMDFINQATPNIRYKLQKIDGLADKSIRELLAVAQRVYNNQKSPEDKQRRTIVEENAKPTQNMARIPLATTVGDPDEKKCQLRCLAKGQGFPKASKTPQPSLRKPHVRTSGNAGGNIHRSLSCSILMTS